MNPIRPLERVPFRRGFLARAVQPSHAPHSLRPAIEPANPGGLLDQIGNTPLVRLKRSADLPGVEIWLKLEFANPGKTAVAAGDTLSIVPSIAGGRR